MFNPDLVQKAHNLYEKCLAKDIMLTTAESCTGGLLSALITSIHGSSKIFDRGFVTYSNSAKYELLQIDMELIIIHGAVSEQIARAMAEGALRNSHAQLTVSITGMASPSIEECRALPGEVWIAVASSEASTISSVFFFEGDREEVRLQATGHALQMMLDYLE